MAAKKLPLNSFKSEYLCNTAGLHLHILSIYRMLYTCGVMMILDHSNIQASGMKFTIRYDKDYAMSD